MCIRDSYNPATLAEHTEEYLGVPQGVYAKDGDPNYYQSYSCLLYTSSLDTNIMKVAQLISYYRQTGN